MAEGTGTLELKGIAPVEEWRQRIQAVAAQIHAHDTALADRRAAVKKKRLIAIGAAVAIGLVAGIFVPPLGVGIALVGAIGAFFAFKLPPADFIGEERAVFVRELVDQLADIAPKGALRLAAQLDARRAVPPAELPSGFGDALINKEKIEAWLSGSIAAVPGLRLGWQVTERRRVKLSRRKVVRRKTKIKTKAKFSLATRLAVRLDADRVLFALKPVANKPRATDGDSEVEVRERPGGWSLRGTRDIVSKTPLWTANAVSGLATLREQGKKEFFGQPAAALITLMRLCEGRLMPAPAKEKAA